jgi:NitT/TauT family transport system substrate-binding protein
MKNALTRSHAIRIAVGGLAGLALPAQAQPALTKVRLGTAIVESYSEGAFAQDHGFLKQGGFDAEITLLPGGGAVTQALLGGSFDFGITNSGSMANAHIRGLPVYCVVESGLYSTNAPTSILAVAKDSPFRTAADLNGKTISVTTLRDLQQAAIMKWVDDNGGDSKTLKFVEVNNSDLVPSMVAKRTDASILLEPWITSSKNDIRIFAKPYDAVAKQLMISGWIVNKSFADANPAAVQRFADTMKATAQWVNRNLKASAGTVATVTKIPIETVQQMNRVVFATSNDPKLIQPVIDVSAKYGFLPRTFDAKELFFPGVK